MRKIIISSLVNEKNVYHNERQSYTANIYQEKNSLGLTLFIENGFVAFMYKIE